MWLRSNSEHHHEQELKVSDRHHGNRRRRCVRYSSSHHGCLDLWMSMVTTIQTHRVSDFSQSYGCRPAGGTCAAKLGIGSVDRKGVTSGMEGEYNPRPLAHRACLKEDLRCLSKPRCHGIGVRATECQLVYKKNQNFSEHFFGHLYCLPSYATVELLLL